MNPFDYDTLLDPVFDYQCLEHCPIFLTLGNRGFLKEVKKAFAINHSVSFSGSAKSLFRFLPEVWWLAQPNPMKTKPTKQSLQNWIETPRNSKKGHSHRRLIDKEPAEKHMAIQVGISKMGMPKKTVYVLTFNTWKWKCSTEMDHLLEYEHKG